MNEDLSGCTACGLCESALTVGVKSRGPLTASVLVVGQAPGPLENTQGVAFIGPSGRKLLDMLKASGFEKGSVRLTNAVRCAPPTVDRLQRPPNTDEIDACRAHLIAEITAMQPKAIIALGDTAMRALCKTSGIGKHRGGSLPLHKDFGYACDVFPTYHSSFVLKKPHMERTVLDDLRKVRDRDMPDDVIKWEWAKDAIVINSGPHSVDIETYREDGTIGAEITQLAWTDKEQVLVTRNPSTLHVLSWQIPGTVPWEHPPIWPQFVTHNGWAFDIVKLREQVDPDIPWGADTMVMAYLVDETQPRGLQTLAVKYCGAHGWKEKKTAKLGTDEFAEYNARDAYWTRNLYFALRDELGERVNIMWDIMAPAHEALFKASKRGCAINQTVVAEEKVIREAAIASLETELRAMYPSLNPKSPQQVGEILVGKGITLRRTPKSGAWQVDMAALQPHMADPFVATLVAHRKATKAYGTYITPYFGHARVHPKYHIMGTIVGRTSASEPSVQNVPRELKRKGWFTAPPGKTLIKADYSGMHFRLAAWLAQERVILAEYAKNPAWDPHNAFGEMFYGRKPTKKERDDVAKSANFSQLFQGDGFTLHNYCKERGVELSLPQCNVIHKAWRAWVPGFERWYADNEARLRTHGFIESVTGRRRHFGPPEAVRKLWGAEYNAAKREALNFEVISLEADIALLALGALDRAGLPIVRFEHDSVDIEFDGIEENARLLENTLRACMITEPLRILRERFNVHLDVPLELEITYRAG